MIIEKIINDTPMLFKDIENCPDYWVSKCGLILSTKRNNHRVLSACKTSRGYYAVDISMGSNDNRRLRLVHRLVAAAWMGLDLGADARTIVVDHIDNNKENNNLENLQIITQKENCNKDK